MMRASSPAFDAATRDFSVARALAILDAASAIKPS